MRNEKRMENNRQTCSLGWGCNGVGFNLKTKQLTLVSKVVQQRVCQLFT